MDAKRFLSLALGMALSATPTSLSAGGFEPFGARSVARFFGVGYGHGYHAAPCYGPAAAHHQQPTGFWHWYSAPPHDPVAGSTSFAWSGPVIASDATVSGPMVQGSVISPQREVILPRNSVGRGESSEWNDFLLPVPDEAAQRPPDERPQPDAQGEDDAAKDSNSVEPDTPPGPTLPGEQGEDELLEPDENVSYVIPPPPAPYRPWR